MSKTFAIVENGKVVNVALSDAPLADNWIQSDEAQIGWDYDGTSFTPPPEPEPPSPEEVLEAERAVMICTPAQMRLTLHRLGLKDDIQAIADSDPEASIVWEYATQIVRNSPFIAALENADYTPERIDDIFRAAMQVQV